MGGGFFWTENNKDKMGAILGRKHHDNISRLAACRLNIQPCCYVDRDNIRHEYVLVSSRKKFFPSRKVRERLGGWQGVLEHPICGSGHMCDMNFVNTWRWMPGKPVSTQSLVEHLHAGHSVFLLSRES